MRPTQRDFITVPDALSIIPVLNTGDLQTFTVAMRLANVLYIGYN